MSKVYVIGLEMREEGPDGLLLAGPLRAFEGIVEEVGKDLPRLGRDAVRERVMLTGDREERLLKLMERVAEALEQIEAVLKELETVRGSRPLPPERS